MHVKWPSMLACLQYSLCNGLARYSEDEADDEQAPDNPAERAQRSKGADLAELLSQTYADSSYTTARYRYVSLYETRSGQLIFSIH